MHCSVLDEAHLTCPSPPSSQIVVVDNLIACIGGLDMSAVSPPDSYDHADVLYEQLLRPLGPWLVPALGPPPDRLLAHALPRPGLQQRAPRGLCRGGQVGCQQHVEGRGTAHAVARRTLDDRRPVGPDVAQHFVERWNFICHLKYRHKSRYPLLAFPHIDGLNDGITRHPHFERLKEEGRHYFCHHREPGEDGAYPPPVGGTGTKGTTRVQVLRSSSDWSHGIHPTEASIQTAYCQMITEAKSFVMISNQFFIAGTGVDAKSPVQNLVGQAIVQRVLRAAKEGKRFKVVILIPAIPGFAGDLKGNSGTLAILGAQYMSLCRGGNSIFELIQREGVDPGAYIEVYNLRSFDRLNYDPQRIKRMEEASGVTLFQAQAALARCVAASASPLSRALAVDRPDPLRPRAQGLPRLGRARVRAREEQGRQVCHPAGRRRGADARRQGQEGQAGQAQPDRRRAAPGVVRGGVGDHPPL